MLISTQNKKNYAKLWHLLAAGFFFSAILPILVIASASISSVRQLSIKEVEFRSQQIVEHRQDALDTWLRSQILFFSTFVRLAPPAALDTDQALHNLILAMTEKSGGEVEIAGLQLIRATDNSILATTGLDSNHFKNQAGFIDLTAVRSQGQTSSAIFTDQDGRACLLLAVSNLPANQILHVVIRADQLEILLKNALTFPDDAVFLFNTSDTHQVPVLTLAQDPARKDSACKRLPSRFFSTDLNKADALQQSEGWLHAAKKLEMAPCTLVFTTKVDNYLDGYLSYRNGIITIVALTAIFFILFSIGASRIIVSRIRQSDQEQTILDQQLADMNKMASIGKLAAGVAHEINNPLQLIQMQAGWIENLLKEESPEVLNNREEYLNSVAKIHEHVKRAATITRRLLGFSRKVDDERDADINALLQKTVSFVESDAYKKNVQLNVQVDPSLPVVRTDTSQLQQILLNLIENALAAVGSDGCIEMSTAVVENKVQVRICDNGPGIPPELVDKIWQPFFTTKADDKGTGLGLAICRDIAKKLGATLTAENRPEGGAAFILYLPLRNG